MNPLERLKHENAQLRHELEHAAAKLDTERRRLAVIVRAVCPLMTGEALNAHLRDTREYVARLEPYPDGSYVCPGCDHHIDLDRYLFEAHVLICVARRIHPEITAL